MFFMGFLMYQQIVNVDHYIFEVFHQFFPSVIESLPGIQLIPVEMLAIKIVQGQGV